MALTSSHTHFRDEIQESRPPHQNLRSLEIVVLENPHVDDLISADRLHHLVEIDYPANSFLETGESHTRWHVVRLLVIKAALKR